MAEEANSIPAIVDRIDRAIIQARLNGLAVMMTTDRTDRLARIAKVLIELKPGAYLIGTGPSTVGIVPLTVDDVVLGRAATPVEKSSEVVVRCSPCAGRAEGEVKVDWRPRIRWRPRGEGAARPERPPTNR